MGQPSAKRRIIRLALLAATLFGIAFAQQTAQTGPQAPTGYPVILDGQPLLEVYSPLGSFSPEERARVASERLQRIKARGGLATDSILLVERAGVTEVFAGMDLLVTVTDGDATALGMTRQALAEQRLAILRNALSAHSEPFTLRDWLVAILLALLVTAALVLLLRVIVHTTLRGENRLDRVLAHRVFQKSRRFRWLRGTWIITILQSLLRVARLVLVVTVLYLYFPIVFGFFPATRGLADSFYRYLWDALYAVKEAFIEYLPDLATALVIVVVTRFILRITHLFFLEVQRGWVTIPGFHKEWVEPTFNLVRFCILALAAVVIFPYLPGSKSPAFQGISIFLGLLLSLGSSSAIANAIAGTILTYTRAFNVGDRVKIADTTGDVVEKSLLATRIRTTKNVVVTVPNSMVLGSHIINYSTSAEGSGLILHTSVTIGYDVPWQKVHSLLIAAANATPDLAEDPPPFVLQTALNDYHVSYEINATTFAPSRMTLTYSELHKNIQNEFANAGVEIMSPSFHAIRDGNKLTVPVLDRADAAEAGGNGQP